MRLTIVNEALTRGGQEQYVILLVKRLVREGVLNSFSFEGGPATLAAELPKSVLSAAASDFPHVRLLNGNRALYMSLRRWRGSDLLVYVQHSSIDDQQAGALKQFIRRILLRLLLRRMDVVIRVSKACLPDRYAPGKIFTVPNGVDLACFPCREAWRDAANPAPLRLLMVGALTANKNQRLAIQALAALPDADLTLVGDGPERHALEAFAQRLGVSGRVRWMGQQPDTGPFYREADVCLLLSQHEAAPFVVLESMASGTPVVATPVGGVPEVIVHGDNGVLLDDADAAGLVKVLRGLAQAPEKLAALGQAARRRIEARYTVDHMAEGFLTLVNDAVQRQRMERRA